MYGSVGAGFLVGLLTLASVAAAEPVRPLIFIPGILGSRLVDANGNLVWGGADSYVKFRDLALPRNEAEIRHKPDGVIRTISIVWPFEIKQYEGLFETLAGLGYREGTTLFVFAYDWRQSNFKTAAKLHDFIEATPALAGQQFDIVAHSMGGLVATILAHEQPSGARLVNLVTLGTPFLGSLDALETSLDGFSGVADFMAGIGATRDQIKSVMLSFESGYELLPAYTRCCILGRRDDPNRQPMNDVFSMSFWQDKWLTPSFSSPADKQFVAAALAKARALSVLMQRDLPTSVSLFMYAGDNFDTKAQVYVAPGGEIDGYTRLGGDGTVFLNSAARDHVPDARVSFQKHARIFDDEGLRNGLSRILTPTGPLTDFAGSAQDATLTARSGNAVVVESLSFEVKPPLAKLGDPVELVLELHGGVVESSQERFDLEACLRSGSGPPLCLGLVEERDPSEPRRFSARVRLNEAGDYTATLRQLEVLEDHFAVIAIESPP